MTGSERKISVEYLRECFDCRDGELYWKERPVHHFRRPADHVTFIKKSAGKPAGREEPRGYMCVKMRFNGIGVCISVHRIVWALHYGSWPEHTIDHIDRNRKNNRIENLRDVTMSVNMQNRGNPRATGIPGVHRQRSGKFTAQIRIADGYIHLGTFDDLEEARRARVMAESAALTAIQKTDKAPLLRLRVV